jgi:predicted metalloprotease with PDZ domain
MGGQTRIGALIAAMLALGAGGVAAEPIGAGEDKGERGYLGVFLAERDGRVEVLRVEEGSPADRSGLRAGDLVLQVDGEKVESAADVTRLVRGHRPGESVRLGTERDGQAVERVAELGSRPASTRWEAVLPFRQPRVRLGLQLQALSDGLRGYFRAPADRGVLVADVVKDAPAAAAGVQAGDVILDVNGAAVASERDVIDALRDLEPGARLELRLLRDGAEREIEVVAAERKGGEHGLFHGFHPGPHGQPRMWRFGGDEAVELPDLHLELPDLPEADDLVPPGDESTLAPEARERLERQLDEARKELGEAKRRYRDAREQYRKELREQQRQKLQQHFQWWAPLPGGADI